MDNPAGRTDISQFQCAGLEIDVVSMSEALATLTETTGPTKHVHLVNSYTVSLAKQDHRYRAAFTGGTLFPDGTPVLWLARIAGFSAQKAVRGPDLMRDTLIEGQSAGLRHFLYGSTVHTLAALRASIGEFAPEASVVGYYSPGFGSDYLAEADSQIDEIDSTAPDIVWVGMGTPRQDFIAQRLATGLSNEVIVVAVGAAFDFLSNMKKEAPVWIRHTGIEWLFRLANEPRRLARRYLVDSLGMLPVAMEQVANRMRNRSGAEY